MLDRNTLITLNKDPKSIDLHNLALAKMNNVKVSPESKHDFIEDRVRTKKIKNMDELFKKINEMKKNGVLDLWAKKYGHKMSLKESTLLENSNLSYKIDNLIENAIMSSTGAPIAPFGGAASSIKDSYAKPQIIKEDCTTQDKGAIIKCKKEK